MEMTVGTTASTGRVRALRIVAVVFGALALVFSVPFAVLSFVDAKEEVHAVHNLGGVAVYSVILGAGFLAVAVRPFGSTALLRGLGLASLAAVVGGTMAGDLIDGFWFVPLVMTAVLFALHPARAEIVARPSFDPLLGLLALASAVPLVAYALTQARLQADGLPADPHVEFHHYSGMAAGALMLLAYAAGVSASAPGARFARWLAGVGMAVMALASLVWADRPSVLEGVWAWLALAWAVAFVTVTEVRARASS